MDTHHFNKQNLEPHQSRKLDPDQSEKIDPDPHQSEKVEALEGHFGGSKSGKSERWDLDLHQIES
jgi:hypothetical protein